MRPALLALAVLAAISLCLPSQSCSGEQRPRPKIDVEVVWSDVSGGKVDLFTLITNPNDFDVYVGRGGSSSILSDASNIFGDGISALHREDFSLVPAKGKRIRQLERGFALKEGLNHFRVTVSGAIDPRAKLPSNYVPLGTHKFEFVIPNGESK